MHCLEIRFHFFFLFAVNDKEAVVQQLVQILTSEGDAINSKVIFPDLSLPFLLILFYILLGYRVNLSLKAALGSLL